MSGETTSANMNLILPGVGTTLGPTWATDLNTSLGIIDSHNHSAGSGVQITPDGLNINSDLTMLNNNLLAARSLRMQVQSAALAAAADLGCLYVTGVDLYYNDRSGNQIQITQSGGVAGTPGSIANLTSPASAAYVAGSSKFVWQSAASTPAIMDSGYLILRNISTSGFGITLTPPTLASSYTITLPTLPASVKFLVMDASGNMSAPYTVDNSSIEVSTNIIQVKAGGISDVKLASDSVTTLKVLDGAITRPKLEAVGQQVSSSSGTFTTGSTSAVDVTNLHVGLTTSGRPVMLRMQSATGADSTVQLGTAVSTNPRANIYFVRDGATISTHRIGFTFSTAGNIEFPTEFSFVDAVAAGTYAYKVQVQVVSANGTLSVTNCVLLAYEL